MRLFWEALGAINLATASALALGYVGMTPILHVWTVTMFWASIVLSAGFAVLILVDAIRSS